MRRSMKASLIIVPVAIIALAAFYVAHSTSRDNSKPVNETKRPPAGSPNRTAEEKPGAAGSLEANASTPEYEWVLDEFMPPDTPVPEVLPNLYKEQQAVAEEAFLQEGRMWANFRGMVANVRISYLDGNLQETSALEATLDVGRPSAHPRPDAPKGAPIWACPVVLRGTNGEWTFSMGTPGSDSSDKEGHWEYQEGVDPKQLESFRLPIVPAMVALPLATLSLVNQGQSNFGVSPDDFNAAFGFWKHPDPALRDEPGSFMIRKKQFPDTNPNDASRVVLFSQGHMSYMGVSKDQDVTVNDRTDGVFFEGYQTFGDATFPTVITNRRGNLVERITFSNIRMK